VIHKAVCSTVVSRNDEQRSTSKTLLLQEPAIDSPDYRVRVVKCRQVPPILVLMGVFIGIPEAEEQEVGSRLVENAQR